MLAARSPAKKPANCRIATFGAVNRALAALFFKHAELQFLDQAFGQVLELDLAGSLGLAALCGRDGKFRNLLSRAGAGAGPDAGRDPEIRGLARPPARQAVAQGLSPSRPIAAPRAVARPAVRRATGPFPAADGSSNYLDRRHQSAQEDTSSNF